LLELLRLFLQYPELADADGARGHRAVLSKYNEENHLETYFNWVEEAIARKDLPPARRGPEPGMISESVSQDYEMNELTDEPKVA
ncbi:MAG: hypothetical protein ACKO85_01820, partial [Isosphaeraceae bacterium]